MRSAEFPCRIGNPGLQSPANPLGWFELLHARVRRTCEWPALSANTTPAVMSSPRLHLVAIPLNSAIDAPQILQLDVVGRYFYLTSKWDPGE